jgi:hypothetical protein
MTMDVDKLNRTSGWRLLLYVILGSWAVGAVAKGVSTIVRGPKCPLADAIDKMKPGTSPGGPSSPSS